MKVVITRLRLEPRYPARYVGRHRAPSSLPTGLAVGTTRRARLARVA